VADVHLFGHGALVDPFSGSELAKGNQVFDVACDLFGQCFSGFEGIHGDLSLLHTG